MSCSEIPVKGAASMRKATPSEVGIALTIASSAGCCATVKLITETTLGMNICRDHSVANDTNYGHGGPRVVANRLTLFRLLISPGV